MANSAFAHEAAIIMPSSSTNTGIVTWSGTGANNFLDSTVLVSGNNITIPGTITFGGTQITSTAAELNLLDGVSGLVQGDFTKLAAVDATAAELNLLSGVSGLVQADLTKLAAIDASAAEINKLDGAGSNVTATNLDALTGGGATALHSHSGGGGDFSNGGDNGALILGTNDSNSLTFETNNTARMVIAAGGDVSVKSTNKLHFGDGTDTYISQIADDQLAFYVGGRHMMQMRGGGVFIGFESGTNSGSFSGGQALPTNPSGGSYENGLHIHEGDAGNYGAGLTISNAKVNHGITTQYDTATYFEIKSATGSGNGGGADVRGVTDSNRNWGALRVHGTTGAAPPTSSTVGSGFGVVAVLGRKKSGSGTTTLASNENLFSVDSNTNVRFIIKGNGDMYGDTSFGGIGDTYDDAQLIRALDIVKHEHGVKGYIQDKWDNFIQYNEQSLIDAGILGDTLANRGLLNYTGLQKFHSGAIWQLYSRVNDQEEEIKSLKEQLVALTEGK